jgi:hypothetical protein
LSIESLGESDYAFSASASASKTRASHSVNGRVRGEIRDALVLVVGFTIALLVSPVAGRVAPGISVILAALLIASLTVVYGWAIRRLLQIRLCASYASGVTVVAGFTSVSLVHLTATAVLNIGAVAALPIDIIVGALLALGVSRLTRPASPGSVGEGGAGSVWFDAWVLLACAALVSFWARETISAVAHIKVTELFSFWQDFFAHASEVSYLRDYPAFGGHSQYLADMSQTLYHRASYAMPALFSALGGVPSLETATAFWMPTGLLLCAVATYAFGAALGGSLAGAAAVATVFLLPDASTYGFQNRFLSFHWLIQIAPGSGYAVALTLLALIVVVTATPQHRARALAGAATLAVAGSAFRIQLGMLASGAIAAFACLAWRPAINAYRVIGALAILAASAAILVWMASVASAPHFLTEKAHPLAFLEVIHQPAAGFSSLYTRWTEGYGDVWTFVVGYALFLVASCGVIIPALAAVWFAGALGRMGWRVASIPVALLGSHVAAILFVPTTDYGDVTEFGHRSFVLVYAVFGAIIGATVGRMLATCSVRWFGTERTAALALGVLSFLGCAVPWTIGAGVQQRWEGAYFASTPISAEAFDAGRFVRRNSMPGELVLAASEDPLAVFVALTERGAFLSRGDLFRRLSSEAGGILARERAREHAMLGGVSTFEQLQSFGRRTGVAWYIADMPSTQRWATAVRARCTYCGQAIQVYDLR